MRVLQVRGNTYMLQRLGHVLELVVHGPNPEFGADLLACFYAEFQHSQIYLNYNAIARKIVARIC